MPPITPAQFDTAARLLGLPYEWKDDGDQQLEPGEVLVKGAAWPQWHDRTFQANIATIDERAKRLLVFPPSVVDPLPAVYERAVAGDQRDEPPPPVDKERLAQRLLTTLPLPSKSCREGAFTAHAKRAFSKLGVDVTIDDFPKRVSALDATARKEYSCNNGTTPPTSGNLIGIIKGDPRFPTWNLSFHLDTNQTKFAGFKREGDVIKPAAGTPLGADDKAGFAIIAGVVEILQREEIPHGDIRIIGLVAEETGSLGAKLVDGAAFKGDIQVSVDGQAYNLLSLGAATFFGGTLTVETHTSHPAAIDRERAVDACAVGRTILERGGFRPDGHPPGEPNVISLSDFQSCGVKRGEKEGGVETIWGIPKATPIKNTVPGFFTARWQMRSLKGVADAHAMAARLKAIAEGVCTEAAQGRTPVHCTITGTEKPALTGYLMAEDAPAVRLLLTGYKMAQLPPPTLNTKPFGGTNGNFVSERFGEEIVLMDTGASQIHTVHETVDLAKMANVARALLGAIIASSNYQRVHGGTIWD